MKKIIFSLLLNLLLLVTIINNANANNFSKQSHISLLTCGSGDQLYSIFGHTAIRIYDSVSHMDMVFNYGTFDFQAEGFYVNFTRGKLDYFLSVSSYSEFMNAYYYEDRAVTEQILNLSYDEKLAIYEFLANNFKGNNKYYKYDFFFDNCTTRVRDILYKVLGDKLLWNEKQIKNDKTFRKSLDDYITQMPWVKFGFYLGLGSVTDRKPTVKESMFLPDRLMNALNAATIKTENGSKPLVAKTIEIYKSQNLNKVDAPLITPEIVFSILLLIVIFVSYRQFITNNQPYYFDLIIWILGGLTGLLVLFLWFLTDHKATANNWNFLWANPLYFLAIGTIVKLGQSVQHKIKYQYLILIINFNLVLISPFFIQNFHPVFLMFMLLLSIRAASNIWCFKKMGITLKS